jgi:hypothetical protein
MGCEEACGGNVVVKEVVDDWSGADRHKTDEEEDARRCE